MTVRAVNEHMFVPSQTADRVIALLDAGLSVAETARRTGLVPNTVRYHRDRITRQPSDPPSAEPPPPPRGATMPVGTREEVRRLLDAGCSRAETARRLRVSKSTVTYHARRFGMEVDHRAARRYDWAAIQEYYDSGHSVRECQARFGFGIATWSAAVKRKAVVGRPQAMPIEQLLAAPRGRAHLKRRLVKAGLLSNLCRECGIAAWRGHPLALQLHHVNGDGQDNRLENLALLCPNCHSQTDTWGGRNGNRRSRRATPAPARER